MVFSITKNSWFADAFEIRSPDGELTLSELAALRRRCRENDPEWDKKEKERHARLLHKTDTDVGYLKDCDFPIWYYVKAIRENPVDLEYEIDLLEELGERDDQIQRVFEQLDELAENELHLDFTDGYFDSRKRRHASATAGDVLKESTREESTS